MQNSAVSRRLTRPGRASECQERRGSWASPSPVPFVCPTLRISCEAVPPSKWPAGAQGGTLACHTGAALSFVSCIRLFCGSGLLRGAPDSDAVDFDDPQASCKRLLRQLADETLADTKDEGLVLARQSENDDPRVLVRWIQTNIAEANVQRNDRPVLAPQQSSEVWVMRAADTLIVDGGGVVARRLQESGDLNWEVLVNLEPHGRFYGIAKTRSRASSAA
jgi:hypothetical protein